MVLVLAERQIGVGKLETSLAQGTRQGACIPLQQLYGVRALGTDRGNQAQVPELELDVDLAELRRIQSDSDFGATLIKALRDLERHLLGRWM